MSYWDSTFELYSSTMDWRKVQVVYSIWYRSSYSEYIVLEYIVLEYSRL